MKQGRSLNDLAVEIDRQNNLKKDYLASTSDLFMQSNGSSQLFIGNFDEGFKVNAIAHQQIAAHLAIPKPYYDRLQHEQPGLLDTNVNTLLRANESRRMVRTLDGNARAFLSDRYRALDNYDLANHLLPTVQEMMLQPVSSELTERKFYIKLMSQTLIAEPKVGDPVRMGLVISNSEVGHGALSIQPMTETLRCTNGMIVTDYAKRSYHVGRLQVGDDEARELFSDATRAADDRAFWMKAVDTIRGVFNEYIFEKIIDKMRASTERKLEGNPVKAVEVVASKYSLTEATSNNVLTHLINGGDLSQYGLMNAVTRAAQDEESYDTATELEALGGEIIELKPGEWRTISTAR